MKFFLYYPKNVFEEINFTPLSSLFFPEGGTLSCRNTDARVSIKNFLKKEQESQKEISLLRRDVRNHGYNTPNKNYKINIPSSTHQIIECDDGDMIIFR